jgi:hypothetical protein
MHLSAATIQEFKEICQDEFGLVLSDDEAAVHASRVLQLIWMLVVESQHSSGSDRS